jgi:hypothetical protein
MRRAESSDMYWRVRMLWRRSASLISRIRMSLDIAISILRKFSACRSRAEVNSIRAILVSPSTRNATCSPKRRRISSAVVRVSSMASCRRPAATVNASRRISTRIPATSSGWIR